MTDIKFIWPGAGGSYPEAPHLFKRNGVYYLMMAEGGTADTHSVTISRSKDPWGPFDPCPHNPILSMRGLMNDIQATGHADFVEDPRGNWWAVFLGIRFADAGVHNLGRETFLAPVAWTQEGWPVVNEGNRILPGHGNRQAAAAPSMAGGTSAGRFRRPQIALLLGLPA